jgi:hypothetical protein
MWYNVLEYFDTHVLLLKMLIFGQCNNNHPIGCNMVSNAGSLMNRKFDLLGFAITIFIYVSVNIRIKSR